MPVSEEWNGFLQDALAETSFSCKARFLLHQGWGSPVRMACQCLKEPEIVRCRKPVDGSDACPDLFMVGHQLVHSLAHAHASELNDREAAPGVLRQPLQRKMLSARHLYPPQG